MRRWPCEKLRGIVLDDGERAFERGTDCSDGRSHSKGMSCAVIIISKVLLHGKRSCVISFLFFILAEENNDRETRSRETFARDLRERCRTDDIRPNDQYGMINASRINKSLFSKC